MKPKNVKLNGIASTYLGFRFAKPLPNLLVHQAVWSSTVEGEALLPSHRPMPTDLSPRLKSQWRHRNWNRQYVATATRGVFVGAEHDHRDQKRLPLQDGQVSFGSLRKTECR